MNRRLCIGIGYWSILALILLCECQKPQKPVYLKSSLSKKGMVASAHYLATQAGLEVMQRGGNAIDAAIAVHFALAVCYPRAGNLGGGGFLLWKDTIDQYRVLDFREKAPKMAHKDMYLDSMGEVVPNLSEEGPLACGVPGSVYGMWELYQNGDPNLKWSELIKPAIRLAKTGFPLTEAEANRLNEHQEVFKKYNDKRCPFIKETPWKTGDILKQEALAWTLEQIANQGAEVFYKGPLAEAWIEQLRAKGSIMNLEDLAAYKAVWRQPLKSKYKNLELITVPPPSSGGITMLQMASILESYGLDKEQFLSPYHIHLFCEAARVAFHLRAKYLGDPDFTMIDLNYLLSKKMLESKMEDYHPEKARKSLDKIISAPSKEYYETTHFTIMDAEGRCLAVTTTLNSNYGCKVWIPEIGCFLNNEMDDFSVKPGVANQYGLVGSMANAIEPDKRMLSSMSPTMVSKNGQLVLALGSPGGPTIISSVLQVILNCFNFEMSLTESLEAGRFHHQWLPDEILMEEGKFGDAVIDSLQMKGHKIRWIKRMGSVNAIKRYPSGMMEGAADPRDESHVQGL